MRISLNLASRPFVELRSFFLRLRIFMVVLTLVAIGLGIALHIERRKLAIAESEMDNVRQRTIAAQNEKLHNESRMRQPVNSAVLERARFLNALFLRKSFSWTAVMMDLENVLPTGVQVTSIEPSITAEGDVVIRLRVSGDRDRAIQLVRNLERSSRFLVPKLSSENTTKKDQATTAQAAAAAAPGAVEFEIFANYNPLPDVATGAAAKSSVTTSRPRNTSAPKKTARPGPHDGVVLKPFVSPRPATTPAAGGQR